MKKQFTKIHTVLRYLLLVLLAVVIGVNIYTWNATLLAGNPCPMPFGFGASVVLSGSMEPELSVGDLLIFQQIDHFGIGDIVVYCSGQTPVVHRIVAMDNETVTAQGDANNAPDDPVSRDAIQGKVIGIIPLVGYAVLVLKTPEGLLATLIAALLLMEGSYRSDKSRKEQEKDKLKAEIRQLMQELQDTDNP